MAKTTIETAQYIALSDLHLWADNYNKGDVDAIALSIRRFGFNNAPRVWQDNEVRGGNHTVKAIIQIKAEGSRPDIERQYPPQNIRVEGDEWYIPFVDIMHLDALEANAFAIADNELARKAVRDEELMLQYLKDISADPIMLEATGFDDDAMDRLKAMIDEHNIDLNDLDVPDARIDEAEELLVKWQVERGQVWEVGKHRVMCGDSTSAQDVTRLLGGERPRLCVTDPPYGVEYDPEWRSGNRTGKVLNDDIFDWREAYKLSPADVFYCWHASSYSRDVQSGLEDAGFEIRSQIIWNKPSHVLSRGHYHWKHEPCHYAVRKGETAQWIGDRTQNTVWDIAPDEDVLGGHSTQKPVECMARPIRNHAGDVYDPFLGSGSTLIACEKNGRSGYGMEINPAYVAVILERLAGVGLEPRLEA